MNKICHTYSIQMGTILGQIFCTFHKDGCILGRNFLYISVKWVHFSGKNICTLGHKSVPEPSITSKIHREPSPGPDANAGDYPSEAYIMDKDKKTMNYG